MNSNQYIILDFDSTFVKSESLDYLADYIGKKRDDQSLKEQVAALTAQGMEGNLSMEQSLQKRLKILNATASELNGLIEFLKTDISDSVVKHKEFIRKHAGQIYIVSSGFKEFIVPIVSEYGIAEDHVYANSFTFDFKGNIIGLDGSNPLSKDAGKIKVAEQLKLEGEIFVVGDGFTDYEIRQAGQADYFFAYTENVYRPNIAKLSDHVAKDFSEVIKQIQQKNAKKTLGKKVLLLENIHPIARERFEQAGYEVESYAGALDEEELCEKVKDVHLVGLRSKTQLTARVLEKARTLEAVGAFCIGTNQIDIESCQQKGVAVFNAPYSNTRSVVELAVAEIILLFRNLIDPIQQMRQGVWNKTAKGSHEIRGKKLGIIGYGNIGSQLSVLAENLGMKVYYYDIVEKLALGNAVKCSSLYELLSVSDVVSVHVDGRPENKHLLNAENLGLLKKGSIFINLSRGHIVDLEALAQQIREGRIAGCAVDVFPTEPKDNNEPFDSPLTGLPNTIITSHIGGSTLEAQENIANYVPSKLIDYLETGSTANNVSLPEIQLSKFNNAHRLIHIHENKSGMLAAVNEILAKHQINILGQFLKTNEKVGYMITSVDKAYHPAVIEELEKIEGTIRVRILY
ncbi:MAG: phosphoglycerate dehydrogenase [Cytophagales bacterium]|nr:phosphoglycerate dehydrogenase [Cytophagales bacterium]